jgi:hypothetical protein
MDQGVVELLGVGGELVHIEADRPRGHLGHVELNRSGCYPSFTTAVGSDGNSRTSKSERMAEQSAVAKRVHVSLAKLTLVSADACN